MSENQKFRKVPVDPNQRGLKRRLNMIQNFASALASKGFHNKKINEPIKRLRVLSCFGNENSGGELPPCEHLMDSETGKGKNYCGACGCGDRKMTWLIAEAEEYSKLDFPKVACPLQMPGFTNYVVSTSDEAEEPVTRKYYIENMTFEDVKKVPVIIGEKQEEPEDTNREIHDLVYIMNPKCGWCKKADPLVEELIKEGNKITILNITKPNDYKLANEFKEEHDVKCGTPLFLNKKTGNLVCGFSSKEVLQDWVNTKE
tara:strand:- start:1762 stop:2535 length:774 start_codon:yes stop_codon:yes gene_type:complete